MVFNAAALQLPVAGDGEDIVFNDVVAAVVLVEAAGARSINDVVPQHDPRRALVGVEPPAAIVMALDIVDQVALHDRAG